MKSTDESLITELLSALKKAREIIEIWHGDVAWIDYQHSPEMRQINTAIANAEK